MRVRSMISAHELHYPLRHRLSPCLPDRKPLHGKFNPRIILVFLIVPRIGFLQSLITDLFTTHPPRSRNCSNINSPRRKRQIRVPTTAANILESRGLSTSEFSIFLPSQPVLIFPAHLFSS